MFEASLQGSNSRNKYKKLLAKVHERVSNSRQDFLHKLSRKLVNAHSSHCRGESSRQGNGTEPQAITRQYPMWVGECSLTS
ncbi:transposase [Scytonema sp. PCC 10023]|uniref:transposase n=1 Tax=Scytonema sp. PCC 10023 TaxID=1680591 RepID=UPI0039C6814F